MVTFGTVDPEARDVLLSCVFGAVPAPHDDAPKWSSTGFSKTSGQCVASVDTTVLDLVIDGAMVRASALRLVAVHPDWRGQGLFRQMMGPALAWCDARSSGSTILYAEEPGLYRWFGFETVPQHAFDGPAPVPCGRVASRALSLSSDSEFIRQRLIARCAVSDQCAIVGAPALFLDALTRDPDIRLAYLDQLEAVIAYEIDGTTLVLVDIVAATIPSLGSILGSLGRPFERVRTLFPPDKLDWSGVPDLDDTGLMLRGPKSAAMIRPFMLPPTTEF